MAQLRPNLFTCTIVTVRAASLNLSNRRRLSSPLVITVLDNAEFTGTALLYTSIATLYVRGRRAAELVAMQYAVLSSYMHVSTRCHKK